MGDQWYGHRDDLFRKVGDRDEWIDWDYALVAALKIIEDGTDRNGLLAWETEPERMEVIAEKKIDKFQAAVDRRTKGSKTKGYTPDPGEYFIPQLQLRGGEWPTYSVWLREQKEKAQLED